MDIFDRAQDLLDRAQEKVADATTLAAWKANQSVRIKAVQGQRTEIEKQIETITLQLGNRIYQLWKDRGGHDDAKIEELCRVLDTMLSRYRDINAELAELNRATYEGVAIGLRSAGPQGTLTILPPSASESMTTQATIASAPQLEPQRPLPAPIASPSPPMVVSPPSPMLQKKQPDAPSPEPRCAHRVQRKAKPCPSCGTVVSAEETYCPHCGYMAR